LHQPFAASHFTRGNLVQYILDNLKAGILIFSPTFTFNQKLIGESFHFVKGLARSDWGYNRFESFVTIDIDLAIRLSNGLTFLK
jgi:hypothetical protein